MFISNEKPITPSPEGDKNLPDVLGPMDISPVRRTGEVPKMPENRIKALEDAVEPEKGGSTVLESLDGEAVDLRVAPMEVENPKIINEAVAAPETPVVEVASESEISNVELNALNYEEALKELLKFETEQPETAEEAELRKKGDKEKIQTAMGKAYLDILSSLN